MASKKKTTKKAAQKQPAQQETTLHQIAVKAADIKSKHIDFFFIAFLEETGLKPSEVELVEKTVEGENGRELRWSFREKTK